MTTIAAINTIPEALDSAARHVPERLAYIEGRRRVNWADVHRVATEAAAGLVSLGLAKGERVAICAENSIDWIVAYHAIVRAGGVGVPVYYELRQGEIWEQVARPGCRFLFATAEVLAKLPGGISGVEHVILLGAQEGEAPIAATMAFDALVQRATIASRTEVEGRRPKADEPRPLGRHLPPAARAGRRLCDHRAQLQHDRNLERNWPWPTLSAASWRRCFSPCASSTRSSSARPGGRSAAAAEPLPGRAHRFRVQAHNRCALPAFPLRLPSPRH
jgi:hypothetical protein